MLQHLVFYSFDTGYSYLNSTSYVVKASSKFSDFILPNWNICGSLLSVERISLKKKMAYRLPHSPVSLLLTISFLSPLSNFSSSSWPLNVGVSQHIVLPFLYKFTILGNLINLGRRQWQPTSVLLPGKSHGWRSLVGCSPWGREESDTTERLHFHFHQSWGF